MHEQVRYTVDRLEADTWIVIDNMKHQTPIAYLLMLTRIRAGIFNRQVTLARFNAADSGPREYHVFEAELYSTIMYLQDCYVEDFVGSFMYTLQFTDIECPALLATQWAGVVCNRQVLTAPYPVTH